MHCLTDAEIQEIRNQFPALRQIVHGKPLVFLDSAASAQRPVSVSKSLAAAGQMNYANVHRGVYTLSAEATRAFEVSRARACTFINAMRVEEIIFTKGTTEALNLLAHVLGVASLKARDEVLISEMEHHANIVPWQLLADRVGIRLRIIPITSTGELDLVEYEKMLSPAVKVVSIVQCSNVLGTINPVKAMIQMAKLIAGDEVITIVDAAQSIVHDQIDVQEMGCDFLAYSLHKLYGPTGLGILYGRYDLLDALPPYQGGGDMIDQVSFEKTTYAKPPYKFEAGTPNIIAVNALPAVYDFVENIGMPCIRLYEQKLLKYATERLQALPGLKILGTAKNKASVITFVVDGLHANDIGTLLDLHGVAVRTGHHCAQPLLAHYGVTATVRVSFAIYNTVQEIDILMDALLKVFKMLRN